MSTTMGEAYLATGVLLNALVEQADRCPPHGDGAPDHDRSTIEVMASDVLRIGIHAAWGDGPHGYQCLITVADGWVEASECGEWSREVYDVLRAAGYGPALVCGRDGDRVSAPMPREAEAA